MIKKKPKKNGTGDLMKHKHHHTGRVSKKEQFHNQHLINLFNHPNDYFKQLGLDYLVMKEARFYHDDNVLAEPDITIFLPYQKQIYLLEYKGTDHLRNKAMHQLSTEEYLMHLYFEDYKIKKYYVHNNYEIEKWEK